MIGEIGCSFPLTQNEKKSLKASAIAQEKTGASIIIHPGRNEDSPFEIIEFLKKENVKYFYSKKRESRRYCLWR